jgi:hypothetical protein
MILQDTVGLIEAPLEWFFDPPVRIYEPLLSNAPNEDFTCFLRGDVSGNWIPQIGTLGNQSNRIEGWEYIDVGTTKVSIPDYETESGSQLTVQILGPVADLSAITNLRVVYDPAVLRATDEGKVVAGDLLSDSFIAVNVQDNLGVIQISAAMVTPISGNGVLFNITFDIVGTALGSTPLNLDSGLFEDSIGNAITTEFTDGVVVIVTPTPTHTPTDKPTETFTPSSTPTEAPSVTATWGGKEFDLEPEGGDGIINSKDLLTILQLIQMTPESIFRFSVFWKEENVTTQ